MDPSDLNIKKLDKILNELAEEGKYVEIRICPRCKSPNVTWAPFQLDVIGHCSQVAKYECKNCGWVGKLRSRWIVPVQRHDLEKHIPKWLMLLRLLMMYLLLSM